MASLIIKFDGLTDEQAKNLLGSQDGNLKKISEYFGNEVTFREDSFYLIHEDEVVCFKVKQVLEALYKAVLERKVIDEADVFYACQLAGKREDVPLNKLYERVIGKTISGKVIAPKTKGQLAFVEAMENHDIVFAIGPAGTGKTYLAVVEAVGMLKKGKVKRIVLTRPAVEAGESLGFLPGDLKEKVDPYLTPLYDALHDMLGSEACDKMMEKGIIEIAPLAYMRGRTLNDAFIILDEAQNTTSSQMKMFLTRLGFNSKMVITGDITQIDLPRNTSSGLKEAQYVLNDIKEIKMLKLHSQDVVRHPLVQKIIDSYEKAQKE